MSLFPSERKDDYGSTKTSQKNLIQIKSNIDRWSIDRVDMWNQSKSSITQADSRVSSKG